MLNPPKVRTMPRVGEYIGLLAVLVSLVALFSVLSGHFFSRITFSTLANQIPALTVIAVGMTLVLIAAGIDLSVGSVMALGSRGPCARPGQLAVATSCRDCAVPCGGTRRRPDQRVDNRPLGRSIVHRHARHAGGGSRGCLSGDGVAVGVRRCRDRSARRAAAADWGISVVPPGRAGRRGGPGRALEDRSWTLHRRHRYELEAVRLSGIDPRPVLVAVFALSGLLAGLGGVFHVAYLESADPNSGIGLELSAIAAVVIGGTSLMGGRGSVINSFLGVLIIAVLQSGLAQIGASEPTKRIVTGAVIVAAVILDGYPARSTRAEADI